MNSITLHPDIYICFMTRFYTLFGVKNEDCIGWAIGPVLATPHIIRVAEDQGGIDFSSLPPDYGDRELLEAALKWHNRENLILEIFDCETQTVEFVERMAMLGGKDAAMGALRTVAAWKFRGKSIKPNWKGIVPYNPAGFPALMY